MFSSQSGTSQKVTNVLCDRHIPINWTTFSCIIHCKMSISRYVVSGKPSSSNISFSATDYLFFLHWTFYTSLKKAIENKWIWEILLDFVPICSTSNVPLYYLYNKNKYWCLLIIRLISSNHLTKIQTKRSATSRSEGFLSLFLSKKTNREMWWQEKRKYGCKLLLFRDTKKKKQTDLQFGIFFQDQCCLQKKMIMGEKLSD
jgi:hypothetical protein